MTAATAPGLIETVHTNSPAHLDELFRRSQQVGDPAAREELCRQFLPLARRLANRYRYTQEPFEDLLQVASIGLLGAIDRYDPERGTSFAGFAIPTILGELKRHFRNTGWAMHVPRGAQELSLRVLRAAQQIATDTGRVATPPAIAAYLELSLEDVLVGLDAAGSKYADSLDAPATEDGADDPAPLIESLGREDDGYGLLETRLSLTVALARLPYLERRVLRMRMQHDMKQTEIAQVLGCSQMQVSRLLRRAADHIQRQLDSGTDAPHSDVHG